MPATSVENAQRGSVVDLLRLLEVGFELVDELRYGLAAEFCAGSDVGDCCQDGVLDHVADVPPVDVVEDVGFEPPRIAATALMA